MELRRGKVDERQKKIEWREKIRALREEHKSWSYQDAERYLKRFDLAEEAEGVDQKDDLEIWFRIPYMDLDRLRQADWWSGWNADKFACHHKEVHLEDTVARLKRKVTEACDDLSRAAPSGAHMYK